MTKDELLKDLKEKFGDKLKKIFEKTYKRIYIDIAAKDIAAIADFMFNEVHARFNTTSCIDMPNGMDMVYHFTVESAPAVVSFRAYLDKKKLVIDSITPIMKGAEWIEREIHELFGVDFNGHPNLKPLLLPDDWPKGLYPLRRDYKEEDYTAKMQENK
jgi:NADH:ubiquinone oxidoreductase subunit C